MLKALATAPGDYITPDTKHSSFKARTTGVSNPVRSPGFRASASVSAQQPAFAAGVPLYLRISPLHQEFQLPLPHSSRTVSVDRSELSPEISQLTCTDRLRALYAQ